MSDKADSASVAPSTPMGSEIGDNAMVTADELVADRCCTCRKPVDEHNSLVIVRSDSKRPEARRCRSCHNADLATMFALPSTVLLQNMGTLSRTSPRLRVLNYKPFTKHMDIFEGKVYV